MPTKPLSTRDLDEVLAASQRAFVTLRGANIFITGGTGFFGHWLLETLLHARTQLDLQCRVTVLTRSAEAFRAKSPHITNDSSVTLHEGDIRTFAFPEGSFTHVVHAATDSGGAQNSSAAYELAESIVDGTRHVLQFARQADTKRLLYTSSGAVYGRSTTLLHTPETYAGASDPLLLQSSYDEGKRMAEHLCIAYAHSTSLEPVIARCFAFVGPHLPLDRHFAIGNFVRAGIDGTSIHIKGDGTPRRSWLYMGDLATWLWNMLAFGEANHAYNVGSDEGYTIREAAELSADTLRPSASGSAIAIDIAGTPKPEAPLNSYVPSVERAHDELRLRVSIPLREAILRTAEWHGYRPSEQ